VFWVFLFVAALILASKFWSAYSTGEPLPWDIVPMVVALIGFAGALAWIIRHWCNFLLGEEICNWRDPK
jgi:hypothetical protein